MNQNYVVTAIFYDLFINNCCFSVVLAVTTLRDV